VALFLYWLLLRLHCGRLSHRGFHVPLSSTHPQPHSHTSRSLSWAILARPLPSLAVCKAGHAGWSSAGSTAPGVSRSSLSFRWPRGHLPTPTSIGPAIVANGASTSAASGGSIDGAAPLLRTALVAPHRAPIDAPAAVQACHVCERALQAWPAGSVPPHTDLLVSHPHAAAPGGSGLCITCASSPCDTPCGSNAAGHGSAAVEPPPAALTASARGAQEPAPHHSGVAAIAGAPPVAQAPCAHVQGAVHVVFIQRFVLRDQVHLLDSMYELGPLQRRRPRMKKHFLPFEGRCWSRRALVAGAVRGLDKADWPAGSVMCNTKDTIMQLTGCVWNQLKMMDAEPCEEHTDMPTDGDVMEQEHALML